MQVKISEQVDLRRLDGDPNLFRFLLLKVAEAASDGSDKVSESAKASKKLISWALNIFCKRETKLEGRSLSARVRAKTLCGIRQTRKTKSSQVLGSKFMLVRASAISGVHAIDI